ncbi:MAG: 3-hydroxy-3-methylglutaryl-CoA lyase, partial [Ruthenibacterium sp.]
MQEYKLLDCTLRDGVYLNDWNFGHDTLTSVFERLVTAGVDVIEIGFLDDRRAFDSDRSIMP